MSRAKILADQMLARLHPPAKSGAGVRFWPVLQIAVCGVDSTYMSCLYDSAYTTLARSGMWKQYMALTGCIVIGANNLILDSPELDGSQKWIIFR